MTASPLAAPWQAEAPANAPANAGLVSTAQLMLFKPGVYAVALHVAHSTPTDIGLPLPSIRLDPLPPVAATDGRAFVSMSGEGGWVSRPGDKVFILVAGGTARVILTIYKAGPDAAAPEIRINNITQDALAPDPLTADPSTPEPAMPAAATPSFVRVAAPGELPLRIAAHSVAGRVVEAGQGEWAGASGIALEGFAITVAGGAEGGLDYQAIMGLDWNTPWFEAGTFCGSRGLSLALLGFRVRLHPALAATHRCSYWGRFRGGSTAGPFSDGAACSQGELELEAVRILVEQRETQQISSEPDTVTLPQVVQTPRKRPKPGGRKP